MFRVGVVVASSSKLRQKLKRSGSEQVITCKLPDEGRHWHPYATMNCASFGRIKYSTTWGTRPGPTCPVVATARPLTLQLHLKWFWFRFGGVTIDTYGHLRHQSLSSHLRNSNLSVSLLHLSVKVIGMPVQNNSSTPQLSLSPSTSG